jgi:hypothetical protein
MTSAPGTVECDPRAVLARGRATRPESLTRSTLGGGRLRSAALTRASASTRPQVAGKTPRIPRCRTGGTWGGAKGEGALRAPCGSATPPRSRSVVWSGTWPQQSAFEVHSLARREHVRRVVGQGRARFGQVDRPVLHRPELRDLIDEVERPGLDLTLSTILGDVPGPQARCSSHHSLHFTCCQGRANALNCPFILPLHRQHTVTSVAPGPQLMADQRRDLWDQTEFRLGGDLGSFVGVYSPPDVPGGWAFWWLNL